MKLIEGGQGRTATELNNDALSISWLALALALLALACFVSGCMFHQV
jgi:hypothetical protein